MSFSDVVFNKGQGGLGRPLTGEDHISSILFYTNVYPSGFSSLNQVKLIASLAQAEAAGIDKLHGGETLPTASVTITTTGTPGDTISLYVGTTLLGTTTVPATPTVTNVATALKVAVNALTSTHGFVASGTVGAINLTAPAGSGKTYNTILPTLTVSGLTAATIVAFTGGVGSFVDVMHYHVAEFFRGNPLGILYVGIFPIPGVNDFSEIQTVQNFAQGKVRQVAVYRPDLTFASTQLDALQAQKVILDTNHMPLSIIYSADISGITDLSTLSDLRNLSDSGVSFCIGQDGANIGAALFVGYGKTISCIGYMLGTISTAKVNENIGWVAKFNASAVELDTPAFGNGALYRSLPINLLNLLDSYHYVFLKKHLGEDGTFFNFSYCAIADNSDYATIENNRTIDKAIRLVRTALLPRLNSPIYVNTDGTLSPDIIAVYEADCNVQLNQMLSDGEFSQSKVIINPAQNVLSTGKLYITIVIVPSGPAKNIVVNIGYAVKL